MQGKFWYDIWGSLGLFSLVGESIAMDIHTLMDIPSDLMHIHRPDMDIHKKTMDISDEKSIELIDIGKCGYIHV